MPFKNKKVLITSGPTWVPIDDVRVISNIATGETGILLADSLQRLGAKVTLLLGPVESSAASGKIKLIRFRFFEELKNKIIRELRLGKYDLVIHNAAVADFKAQRTAKGKLDSGKSYLLKLKPLPKITLLIRRYAPGAKIIIFKLESGVCDNILIQRAGRALINAAADFIVANRITPYRAFIMDRKGCIAKATSKGELVRRLLRSIK
ncbi:MAG: phosphopantothenoylcysteine decarboxylase [Candidatus Omnitrophota bacterium]|nr:phosphopantothenoylcysteine decarboxylase [Candidatus Omnitrophota bacterium]